MRIAILDLGTNTFNILIAEPRGHSFTILAEEKVAVKLGKGSIQNNIISSEAMERGIHALLYYKTLIEQFKAEKTFGFATSAVRSAKNGGDFIRLIKEKTGFEIKLITGDREAELIYFGVRASTELDEKKVIILDVGGGSNEFIIANKDHIFWKESFNLGMARIIEKFHISDPITKQEIQSIEEYFTLELTSLYEATRTHNPEYFIGASGTFETFAFMIRANHPGKIPVETGKYCYDLDLNDYKEIHDKTLFSTISERKRMKGLMEGRIEMIVPATIFVNHVIRTLGIEKIKQSDFSLKEGAMWYYLESVI